jgi:hypothetical protein
MLPQVQKYSVSIQGTLRGLKYLHDLWPHSLGQSKDWPCSWSGPILGRRRRHDREHIRQRTQPASAERVIDRPGRREAGVGGA